MPRRETGEYQLLRKLDGAMIALEEAVFADSAREGQSPSPSLLFFLGVSGGLDSMSLLHLFMDLREEYQAVGRELDFCVLHFDHQLRGEASAADRAFVEDFCQKEGIPCFSASGEVEPRAREEGLSLELAARQCRYRFFEESMREEGKGRIPVLSLAHHAEDQTESILLHFFRGSGMGGLSGMRLFEGRRMGGDECGQTGSYRGERGSYDYYLFRPLLGVSRAELEAYSRSRQLDWREDASNQDHDFTRNAIRLDLLPWIREELNPSIDQTLARQAEVLQGEDDYLNERAGRLFDGLCWEFFQQDPAQAASQLSPQPLSQLCQSPFLRNAWLYQALPIPRKLMEGQPLPIQRRFIYQLLARLLPEEDLTFARVEEVRSLFFQPTGKRLSLCGMIFLSGHQGILVYYQSSAPAAGLKNEPVLLDLTQIDRRALVVNWAFPPLEFRITKGQAGGAADLTDQRFCYFDRQGMSELLIRQPEAGDVFARFGGGRKPLRKMFNEWQLPEGLRPFWPVVTDGEEILWLPLLGRSGIRKAEKAENMVAVEWRAG